MGTRNLTCVFYQGEYKVAQYGQWDGYPDGAGVDILRFLHSVNLDVFKERVAACRFATEQEIDEINAEIKKIRQSLPEYDWAKQYPQFSRDTGNSILQAITFDCVTELLNNIEFAADTLSCEWAYVIDLDKNTFEVYDGFNTDKPAEDERFAWLLDKCENENSVVKHVISYPLNELPDEKVFCEYFKTRAEIGT
jgi:hypothetical protein